MMRARKSDIGIAFAAHLSGLLFGGVVIVGLVPAVAELLRLL
jgi:membrane associated rhomboid family serine protease